MQDETQTSWRAGLSITSLRAALADQGLVFRARLGGLEPRPELLSMEEREVLDRRRLKRSRDEYLLTRSFLRITLAGLLDFDPAELRFAFGALGKPTLLRGDLAFNLSHSGDLLLLAIEQGGALGIDVEQADEERDWLKLSRRYFSERETVDLAALDPDRRQQAGYELWTRKEAVLKAFGSGVFERLGAFSVSIGPDARILESWPGEPDMTGYEILDLPLAPARAALCRRRSEKGLLLIEDPSWTSP